MVRISAGSRTGEYRWGCPPMRRTLAHQVSARGAGTRQAEKHQTQRAQHPTRRSAEEWWEPLSGRAWVPKTGWPCPLPWPGPVHRDIPHGPSLSVRNCNSPTREQTQPVGRSNRSSTRFPAEPDRPTPALGASARQGRAAPLLCIVFSLTVKLNRIVRNFKVQPCVLGSRQNLGWGRALWVQTTHPPFSDLIPHV